MVLAKMTVYSDARSGEHGIGVDDSFFYHLYVYDGSVVYFIGLMVVHAVMYVHMYRTRTVLRRKRRE
jgi:hypothetical protein